MIVNFVGRVRIVDAAQRGGETLPFTVEVWNDEADEQDGRLERKFKSTEEAHAYAKCLTALSPAPSLTFPIIREHEPRTRWSLSAVIRAEL